ncbi:UNVERIFIED_CONTAM: GATA transcription factor 5 [Sesamum radiatum]|uniref:GATA transcription factor n=1 Tax=Sesamum radiatum TaxID=300843 RepID=A0AAW2VSK0_SESRA
MECVQGAWVSGFGSETALKTAAFMDDFFGGPNAGASGEDLFVDQLLDFSNDFSEADEQTQQVEEPEKNEQDKKQTCSEEQTPPENSAISAKDDFGSLPEGELSVLAEGLESLEWLSHFVEDSFSDYSLTGKLPPKPAEKRPEPENMVQEQPCFTTPIQTKARTKRARTGVRVWPVLSPSFAESSTSSSSSTSSTTSLSPQNPWAVQSQTGDSFLGKPLDKKHKKKPADASAAGSGGGAGQPRRCSHCGVTKTPQWRAGPLGSKTLCNACGVRYKSGRLLPEYRPACSPTFSSELHSNNHRKVLEMRRKKEVETEAAGLPRQSRVFEELLYSF